MRARYYNPRIMRFCNADPIQFDGGMNWYAAFGNNPISNTDPSGLWFGADDGFAFLVGAGAGLIAQGASDAISGHFSGFSAYGVSGLAGGVGGTASLYVTPVGGAAIGGAVKSLLTQDLQSNFQTVSVTQVAKDAAVSAVLAKIPVPGIPGLTAGANSFKAIAKSTATKLENGTIENVAGTTVAKAIAAKAYEKAAKGAGKDAATALGMAAWEQSQILGEVGTGGDAPSRK